MAHGLLMHVGMPMAKQALDQTAAERTRRFRARRARGVVALHQIEITELLVRQLLADGYIPAQQRDGTTHVSRDDLPAALDAMIASYAGKA